MSIQKQAFLQSEGDRWYERNIDALKSKDGDPVLSTIVKLRLNPKSILEIGCANGWRLKHLTDGGAECFGIDPSEKAIREANNPNLKIGTADNLPFPDNSFDLVIFGFCLYLVDPSLHFRCVAEADRVLSDGGTLIIFDFQSKTPYFNDYTHLTGMRSYKMEHSDYFLASPAYAMIYRETSDGLDPDNRIGVDVLIKDQQKAFPKNPFR
jgi:ubiquinone/menaquinone biosynthesis C-methylase UbiE